MINSDWPTAKASDCRLKGPGREEGWQGRKRYVHLHHLKGTRLRERDSWDGQIPQCQSGLVHSSAGSIPQKVGIDWVLITYSEELLLFHQFLINTTVGGIQLGTLFFLMYFLIETSVVCRNYILLLYWTSRAGKRALRLHVLVIHLNMNAVSKET